MDNNLEAMNNITLISLSGNDTVSDMNILYAMNDLNFISDETGELRPYLRVTCLIFLCLIFTVGVIGNVLVILVIGTFREMRTNSTNIFLCNLSIADLLVLLVCTPTLLIEVMYHRDRWILGFYLCKFIPLLEATVANSSVLTVLSISFERYYAICKPLRANYICTKSRAICICVAAWVLAFFISSPIILMLEYREGVNEDLQPTARCTVLGGTFWADTYSITTIVLFFVLPFFVLLVIYGMISHKLTIDRSALNAKNENHKGRKQVVTMLCLTTFTLFLCLLPFRVLTMFIIMADHSFLQNYAHFVETFNYVSRLLIYLNSSLNPILYNVMSSKFRNSFASLCSRNHRKRSPFVRNGTFLTTGTNSTTNSANMSINLGHQSCRQISSNGKGSWNGTNNTQIRSYNPLNESPHLSTFRNKSKTQSNSSSNNVANNNYSGINFKTTSVKSDALYSAYIPGKRNETVL